MPLPSSGRISADLIRTEFGRSGQRIAIGDFVRGGGIVPDLPANANISLTKSNLRWSHFYGSATGPTYALSRSAASTNEGTSVTYTLTTTNVANGTLVPYTISGVSSADISGASLTGNFTVSNGSATLTLTIANDATTEGSETMTITAQGQTSSILINDTSLTPTYSISRSTASANEGTSVTYTLTTTSVANGTLVPYTISGVSSADISGASLTGNFTVSNGSATLTLTIANDSLTEGTETMTITAQGQSSAITINDTSVSLIPTVTGGRFNFPNSSLSDLSTPRSIPSNLYNAQGYLTAWPVANDTIASTSGNGGSQFELTSLTWNGTRYICSTSHNWWDSGGNCDGCNGSSETYYTTWHGNRPANITTGPYYPWNAVWTKITDTGGFFDYPTIQFYS